MASASPQCNSTVRRLRSCGPDQSDRTRDRTVSPARRRNHRRSESVAGQVLVQIVQHQVGHRCACPYCGAAQVRQYDDVDHLTQLLRHNRFAGEHIKPGTSEPPLRKQLHQSFLVNEAASAIGQLNPVSRWAIAEPIRPSPRIPTRDPVTSCPTGYGPSSGQLQRARRAPRRRSAASGVLLTPIPSRRAAPTSIVS